MCGKQLFRPFQMDQRAFLLTPAFLFPSRDIFQMEETWGGVGWGSSFEMFDFFSIS